MNVSSKRAATSAVTAIALAFVGMTLAAQLARADEIATLPDGRTVLLRSNGTYQIQPKPVTPAGAYKTMRMSDLKVDLKDLVGQKVSVVAKGHYMADQLIIGEPTADYDINGVMVKIDDLPRDMRMWIVTKCAEQCRVTVEGEVSTGGIFGPGIIAHAVKGK